MLMRCFKVEILDWTYSGVQKGKWNQLQVFWRKVSDMASMCFVASFSSWKVSYETVCRVFGHWLAEFRDGVHSVDELGVYG